MPDVVVTHGEGDGGSNPAVEIAQDLGAAQANIEHHAEELEKHGEEITDVKEDAEWTKRNLDSLSSRIMEAENRAASIPPEFVTETREALDRLTSTVTSLVSDGVNSLAESGELTKPPDTVENKAEKEAVTGPFAGVRKLLHRLL